MSYLFPRTTLVVYLRTLQIRKMGSVWLGRVSMSDPQTEHLTSPDLDLLFAAPTLLRAVLTLFLAIMDAASRVDWLRFQFTIGRSCPSAAVFTA